VTSQSSQNCKKIGLGTIHKQRLHRGGEGGGTHQKEMKGNIGRDPVFSRGDVFFKIPESP
jgi:hypothetical protein